MKTCHVVLIVLNAYLGPVHGGRMIHGSHGSDEDPRWSYLKTRVPIFLSLTARSLAAQTSSDFHVVMLYDKRLDPTPLFEGDPSIEKLGDRFHLVGVPPIDFKRDLKNSFWVTRPDEDEVINKIADGSDRLLITHIDSDDCYRTDAISLIASHNFKVETQVLVTPNGYIHHVKSGDLGHYVAPSPPFYTLVYPTPSYIKGRRYKGGAGHHSSVRQLLRDETLDTRLYMVNVHGANDSTKFASRGALLPGLTASIVRRSFGISS